MDPSWLPTVVRIARQLRRDAVRATAAAGSGHPTSSLSAADLLAVLGARHLRWDIAEPRHPGRDHLILSKGHAAPVLYALLKAYGAITDDELLTLRRAGSRLEGHPTTTLPQVDVASGSLGLGLPVAVGIAHALRLRSAPGRVWVLAGDGELAEGSIWESAALAAHDGLDRIALLVDVNRLGQRGPTMSGWDTASLARRFAAFGFDAAEVDGHDLIAVDAALAHAAAATAPAVILARTVKGRGVPAVEDRADAHGKVLADPASALAGLADDDGDLRLTPPAPPRTAAERARPPRRYGRPHYRVGEEVATRVAFGEALAALADVREDLVAIDAEVANSTGLDRFAQRHPGRFLEAHIAEQQLVAAAIGLAVRGFRPVASTFGAFMTRAHDVVRMASITGAPITLVGSHAGVEIGEDGPSQMALEDLALFRSLAGSTVLYPSDANQVAILLEELCERRGVGYLRTTRGALPVLYPADASFHVGGSAVARTFGDDDVTIVAAGVTVHEALRAADRSYADGVRCRVIDAYSVKPLDGDGIVAAVVATQGRLVIAEDHRPEGGLGEAVLSLLAGSGAGTSWSVEHLAVEQVPASATPAEQLRTAGIDPPGARGEAAPRASPEWRTAPPLRSIDA